MRFIADRCLDGEFNGSARKASRDPECIRLGIDESTIRYHIGIGDPAAAAARASDRARVATETAAAEADGADVQFVFVERAGSAPAAAAVVAALGAIETQIGGRLERVAKLARTEASTALQVEFEAEAGRRGRSRPSSTN